MLHSPFDLHCYYAAKHLGKAFEQPLLDVFHGV